MFSPKYSLSSGEGEGHAPTYRERKPKGWTSLYHSDYLLATSKSYPIWHEYRMHMDIWNSGFAARGTAKVSFTDLVAARVIATVTAQVWPSTAKLFLNGIMIKDYNFNLGGGQANATIDVTSLILNGSNEFSFTVSKVGWVGWGDYVITVDLVIDAETSDVSPPAPWDTWPTWWPYAAAGAGLAVVGGVILLSKRGGQK